MADSHIATDMKHSSIEVTGHLKIPIRSSHSSVQGKEGEIIFDKDKNCLMIRTINQWKCFKALSDEEYSSFVTEKHTILEPVGSVDSKDSVLSPLGTIKFKERNAYIDLDGNLLELTFLEHLQQLLNNDFKDRKIKRVKLINLGEHKDKIVKFLKNINISHQVRHNDIVITL